MGLGDSNLSMGFMKNTSGARSTADEMEYMNLRNTDGRKLSASSFYEETGSMPVAKTLARHYKSGGRRYENGGELKPPKNGEYYTQEEINEMSEEQYAQMESLAGPSAGDVSGFIPQGPRIAPQKESKSFGQMINPIFNDKFEELGINDAFMPTNEAKLNKIRARAKDEPSVNNFNEDFSEFDNQEETPIPAPTPTQAKTFAAKKSRVAVDPRIASRERANMETVGSTSFAKLADDYVEPDLSQITEYEGTDPSTIERDNWWVDNKDMLGRGLGNAASGLLNIAPHLSNIKAYRNTPGVRAPNLQRTVQTQAPSFEASRQAIMSQGRNAMNMANSSGQSNAARNAAALAQTQSSLSRLSGQEAQAVATNDARNAQAANQASAQNMNRLNRNLEQQTSRDLAMQRGIAREKGNIASKTLGFIGDLSKQKLDREKMALTQRRYDQFGVMQRDAQAYYQANGEWPSWYTRGTS